MIDDAAARGAAQFALLSGDDCIRESTIGLALIGDIKRATRSGPGMLSSLIEHPMMLIHVKDLDGRYLLYNTRFADAFALQQRAAAEGIPERDILLFRDDQWLDPLLAPTWREHDLRACRGPLEVEEFFEHPERGRLSFDSIKFPLLDENELPYATCGVSLETTETLREQLATAIAERTAIEAALADAERRAIQILETALDAYISLDEAGLITAWSKQAEALFGWSREEVLGREMAEILIPAAHREAHRSGIRRFLTTGYSRMLGRRVELVALHRNGLQFLIEMGVSAIETSNGYTFSAFLRDITERRRTALELELARDQAIDASRMKSIFVANMSHEIRTPMNGVIGMNELLLETELDDEQLVYAQTIAASGEALLVLIDDILDLSKIEAGKIELDPTDFDLRDEIERACRMLAPRARLKGLAVTVDFDPGVPPVVHADAGRLRQVVTNFLSNAIKFTPAGEVLVSVSASQVSERSELIRVAVSDSGIGIDSDALKHLFMPFRQADSSTTRKYGGTGLGLAISRQLVSLMGGSVGAESEPGEGSTFWCELPLARPSGAGVHPAEHRAPALAGPVEQRAAARARVGTGRTPSRARSLSSPSGPLILVVDDTPINRAVMTHMLEKCGYRSHAVENGRQALQTLSESEESYAAVLMDCQMPVLDGYETTGEIRRLEQGCESPIPIIAITATSLTGERERCLAVGMDDYLTKPLRKQLLSDTLARWIPGSSADSRGAVASDPATAAAAGRTGPALLDELLIAGLENLGDGILSDALSLYFDGTETQLAALGVAIGFRDILVIGQTAHSLKGASATVGAARVACIAGELEASALADDLAAAPALLDSLRRVVVDTREAFHDRVAPEVSA